MHSLAPPRVVARKAPVTRTSPHPGFSPLPRAMHPMLRGHERPRNTSVMQMLHQREKVFVQPPPPRQQDRTSLKLVSLTASTIGIIQCYGRKKSH
ncbi:uncharacterized protein BJ212DRAFT_1326664 [Suillus subaureus]|uniref:Uncharacterized protein n=1 Tax=Suillus subaureus TaxID=48587 RepID=A0A9P7EJK1_9AGAM|nr:uncharacterized protein BJ212DRAFT_1326664 [Suillus subaureus]KAG1823778.1 hypothetical protein BJ212DRAFT_1326664 [Suillus subaureus]